MEWIRWHTRPEKRTFTDTQAHTFVNSFHTFGSKKRRNEVKNGAPINTYRKEGERELERV